MSRIVIKEQGAVLGVRNGKLLCYKSKRVLLEHPLNLIEQVIVYGNVQLSTQLLKYAMINGIDIGIVSTGHQLIGWIVSEKFKGQLIRLKQYEIYLNPEKRKRMAKSIAVQKLSDQINTLDKTREHPDLDSGRINAMKHITELKSDLISTELVSIETIRGFEGRSAKAYFEEFYRALPIEWTQNIVKRRDDSFVNSLLNLSYAMLEMELITLCSIYGLEVSIGFLHELSYGRKSLVYDLMEFHRSSVVDCFVIHLIKSNLIQTIDFVNSEECYRLNEKAFEVFINAWHNWINLNINGSVSNRQILENTVKDFKVSVMKHVDSQL